MTAVQRVTNATIADIRDEFIRANHKSASVFFREAKIAFRRMMSRYWDNSSPFALDLVGAVIRQGTFISKMHSIDWVRSPTAPSTMTRLLTKYLRFIDLMAAHPLETLVPTLDIDLAWHTHQLSPPAYYAYTVLKTKRFINHDDKIEQTTLNNAFETTSQIYQKEYNELYSECVCWYCSAIRVSHPLRPKRRFNFNFRSNSQSPTKIETQVSLLSQSSPPPAVHTAVHISAHSSISSQTTTGALIEANTFARLEDNYLEAWEYAAAKGKKKGSPAIPRASRMGDDIHSYPAAFGCEVRVPNHAPYMPDPSVTPGLYAENPRCAAPDLGVGGDCAPVGMYGMVEGNGKGRLSYPLIAGRGVSCIARPPAMVAAYHSDPNCSGCM
jgi:Glycine-rich domain-containing protein-like